MNILKTIKYLYNLIGFKKNGFWYVQGVIFIIAIIIVQTNSLLSFDMVFRRMITKIRNISIETKENNFSLVALDENFFTQEQTSYSGLHRGYYAKVIENLIKNEAKLVVVDVFFEKGQKFSGSGSKINIINEIFGSFDESLGDAINEKVILASIYEFGTGFDSHLNGTVKKPDNIFLKNKPYVGHVHSVQINDVNIGIYNYLQDKDSKEIIYPIGIQAYIQYTINQLKKIIVNGDLLMENITNDEKNNFLKIKIGNVQKNIPWVRYGNTSPFIFTPIYYSNTQQLKDKNAYISFYDAYKGTFNKEQVKDKVIFIGATDIALNDIKNTLLGPIPGVLTHLNLFLSIINNDYIYILEKKPFQNIISINKDPTLLFILGILLFNTLIFRLYKRKKENTEIFIIQLVTISLIITIGQILLAMPWNSSSSQIRYSIFLPIGTLSVLLLIQIILNLIYSYLDTYNLKDSFQRLFKIYVGTKVDDNASERIEQIEKGHKNATEKDVVIFFSDIAGFTEMSEKLTPEQNIITLNEYLEDMTKEIISKGGIIDKFIGDAIMAYWSDANLLENGARSAIGNIMNLKSINKRIKKQLDLDSNEKDLIDIRIGLHFGKVIHGDIGYSGRLNETIIGDNVNLASRLEGINKYYKTRICMSGDFRNCIKNKEKFLARKLDKITVKGKNKPVDIYELFPVYPELVSNEYLEQMKKFINQFELGLQEYFMGNFLKAIDYFEEAKQYTNDKTSVIFIERCNNLIEKNIENWDGIRKFDSK